MASSERPGAGCIALLLLPLAVLLLEWVFEARTAGGVLLRVLIFALAARLLWVPLGKSSSSEEACGVSANGCGTTVLQCRLSRSYPAIWMGVASLLVLEAGLELAGPTRPGSWPAGTGLVALDVALALAFAIVAVRELRKPRILFEVTDRGIVLNNFGNHLVRGELFLPWERILAVSHPQRMDPSTTGIGNVPPFQHSVIALKVRRDAEWPPAGSLQRGRTAKVDDEVYLDAQGYPKGLELFRELEAMRAKYSGTGQRTGPAN